MNSQKKKINLENKDLYENLNSFRVDSHQKNKENNNNKNNKYPNRFTNSDNTNAIALNTQNWDNNIKCFTQINSKDNNKILNSSLRQHDFDYTGNKQKPSQCGDISPKGEKSQFKDFSIYQSIIDYIGICPYNLQIYAIVSLFFLADGGEMIVLSLILSKISRSWNLSSLEKGFLGSSVFIGIFIGALLCGRFSDIKGRKPVFIVGSLFVMIFAFLSAFVNNYFSFFMCRGVCGVGVGLSMPSAFALAAEITPTKIRHKAILAFALFFPLGEIFVMVLAKLLLPLEWGWRYLLAFASLPCLIAFLMALKINESPKFLFTVNKFEEGYVALKKMIDISQVDLELNENIKYKIREEFTQNNCSQNNKNASYSNINNEEAKEQDKEYSITKNITNLLFCFNLNGSQKSEEFDYEANIRMLKKLIDQSKEVENKLIVIKRPGKELEEDDKLNSFCFKSTSSKKSQKLFPYTINDSESFHNRSMEQPLAAPAAKENKSKRSVELKYEKNFYENEKSLSNERLSLISLKEDINSPDVEFKELLNKKFKFLSVLIWCIFFSCAIVFYGMIYILPQILEKIQYEEYIIQQGINSEMFNNTFNINNSNYDNYNKRSSATDLNRNVHDSPKSEFENMSNSSLIQLIISALMQIPSTLISTYLAGFGRVRAMGIGFLLTFIFSMLSLFSKSLFFYSIALMKFFICLPGLVSVLYVCEAYPTKIRSLGMGVANSFYRIGGILTPFLNQLLFDLSLKAPFALFSIGSFIGFIVTMLLPFETLNKNIQ